MTELADYGPGYPGDSPVTKLARLQQAWFRRDILGIEECGTSPNTKAPLQSYLPAGQGRGNFLSDRAYEYALQRLDDKAVREPDLTIVRGRLLHNMLSSQPMCFSLFADLRADAAGSSADATATLAAMFPQVPVECVDSVVVEEVPSFGASGAARDKTGWDAAIRCNDGSALITVETKYTDKLDELAPARGNDALFAVVEQMGVFTKDGLAYYRDLRRKPRRAQRGQSQRVDPARGGFDQLARNLVLTLRYAKAHQITHAVNYVLAPAFDTESRDLVEQLRDRLNEEWRDRVQYRTIDAAIAAGRPAATVPTRTVLDDFVTRYLDLNPARRILGLPTVDYATLSPQGNR